MSSDIDYADEDYQAGTPEQWDDSSPSFGDAIAGYMAVDKIAEIDERLENGLVRYRDLFYTKRREALQRVEAFEEIVAERTAAIFAADCYPDPLLPEAMGQFLPKDADGALMVRKKVTRVDAETLAEKETQKLWMLSYGRLPHKELDEVRSEIHMLQHHLRTRAAQLSGAQTFGKLIQGAIEGR